MLKDLSREQMLILLGFILVILVGLGVMAFRHLVPAGAANEIPLAEPQTNMPVAEILAHISGAIRNEGVYKLKAGDRVVDAIRLAGGALPQANLSAINLAEEVKDGQKIIVPEKPKLSERVSGDQGIRGSGISNPSVPVNINLADETTLCTVKGIGPKTAQKIIDCREKNGPFSKIEDITKVSGIGKGKLQKIKDQITI